MHPARHGLGFEHGADLPDPHGLLAGTPQRPRYLRFSPDVPAPTTSS